MSIRALLIGMVLILGAGAVAALLLRAPDGEDARSSQTRESQSDTSLQFPAPTPRDDAGHAHPLAKVGTTALTFELERLDGGTFSLDAHRGRVILLNFWATWCEPCRDEMPDLQQLWEAYQDDGLLVVGVSMDEEGRPIVEEFHQTFPVEFPLLLNGLEVAAEYGADHVVPTSFIIDRDGLIVDRHIGAITREDFEERIRAVL